MADATVLDPNLAGVIEEARKRAGLTKYRLAIRSGLSPSTIRMACKGLATTHTLAKLALVFGVAFDDLRGREASP